MMNIKNTTIIFSILLVTINASMAESYWCEGYYDNGNPAYKIEYNPHVNDCEFFLCSKNIKNDPAVALLQSMGVKNAEEKMLKHYQEQYNSCMKYRQMAANDYRQGKCKKLVIKEYMNGTQKCEEKYLDGKKIISSCFEQ